jgi:hypothetical protein
MKKDFLVHLYFDCSVRLRRKVGIEDNAGEDDLDLETSKEEMSYLLIHRK